MLRIDVEDLFQSYIGSTPHTQDGSHHQHHYIFRFGDPYKPSFATGILRKVSRLSDRDPPLPKYHTPLLVEEGILIDSYSCTRNPGNNEKKHTLITLINHQSLFLMLPSWNTKNDSSGRPADSLAAWFPRRIFQRWNRGVMWKFRPWGRGWKILGKHPAFKSWDWCTQWLEKCHRFHGPLKIMEGSRNPESKTAITKDLFHTGKKNKRLKSLP